MSRTRLKSGLAHFAVLAMFPVGSCIALDDIPKIDSQLGEPPKGWIHSHGTDFLAKQVECVTCHGSYREAVNAGGISNRSCFSCHSNGVTHGSDYRERINHGRNGAQINPKSIPASLGPTPMAGIASCKKCHGDEYRGRGMAVSCMSCHRKAPHPDGPWTGADRVGYQVSSHYQTHVDNAAACAQCHARGQNSTRKPAAEPTTDAIGCYNNSLCHAYDI